MDDSIEQMHAYIAASHLLDQLGLAKDYRLSFLAQGEYNRNYLLQDDEQRFVLRVNYGSQIAVDNQIEYEHHTLLALQNSGVTPRPYFVDGSYQHIPQGVLVMAYIEGRPLDYSRDIEAAAKIFAQIHATEISEPQRAVFIHEQRLFSDRFKEASRWLQDVWQSEYLSAQQKDILQRVMRYAEDNCHQEQYFIDNPLRCINNTEVNSHNFIINDQRPTLVDWEKAVVSDPCQDLTHFMALTTTRWKTESVLDAQQQELFFNTYLEAIPAFQQASIRERVELYKPYLNLRAISWCAYAYVEYQRPDRPISNASTYLKLQEYLDVDFLKTLFRSQLN